MKTFKTMVKDHLKESVGNLTNVSDTVLKSMYQVSKKSSDKDAKTALSDIQKEMKKRGLKEDVETIDEISQELKNRYKDKASAQVKELEPHAKKGEYKDIAKNIIAKRKEGLKKVESVDEGWGAGAQKRQQDDMNAEATKYREKIKAEKPGELANYDAWVQNGHRGSAAYDSAKAGKKHPSLKKG